MCPPDAAIVPMSSKVPVSKTLSPPRANDADTGGGSSAAKVIANAAVCDDESKTFIVSVKVAAETAALFIYKVAAVIVRNSALIS